eukprot:scaffold313000_cov36-Tisochrysis_lutea.AAC.1
MCLPPGASLVPLMCFPTFFTLRLALPTCSFSCLCGRPSQPQRASPTVGLSEVEGACTTNVAGGYRGSHRSPHKGSIAPRPLPPLYGGQTGAF